ncbi:PREDICTED: prostaglandin E2 receptor EP4 subtype-like [Branchiostoma belcheri]|uniref:Prostaglandin E2 receptor EP4 subtype-like n=1 Tax=Branchiostoma belcheri TaxID=7741 RepID=A0A6P4ZPZ1_BRABE|nr:PREDICTED: prostaglandin E2 receptor EP4 subtype-like [Branchiostoma belcheri]
MNESEDSIQWPIGSTIDDIGPLWYLSYFTLVPCVIAGFVANVFFIVVSQEVFNQRPTVPNLLLKYLAWTDVLNCSFGVVPIILAYHLKIFTRGVCAFHGTVFTAFSVASQMVVALMSTDRYLALVHPFFYSKYLLKCHRKMTVAVYIIFVYSGVSASLPLFGLNRNVPHPPNSYCMFDWADQTPKGRLVVYLNLMNMFLCLLLIMIMNGVVGVYMYRLRRLGPKPCVASESRTGPPTESHHRQLQLQMTKLTFVVAIVFFCCWFPFAFRVLTNQLGVWGNEDADWFASRLMTMNSVINPFLYVIMWKPYRKGCWALLKTCLHYMTCTLVKRPTITLHQAVSV